MVTACRSVASTACLLIHRTSAFAPISSSASGQISWKKTEVLRQVFRQRPHCLAAEGDGSDGPGVAGMKSSTNDLDVFALDFDGVICNSQGESSRSGYKAVKRLWPDLVSRLLEEHKLKEDDDAPGWMLDKMRDLRPVVETGYENALLVRLLIEEKLGSTPPVSDKLLDTWGPRLRDELIDNYGVSKDELVEAFGRARDEWIETDFQGWLEANSFYPGVREAITACEGETYVVTTKQQRFANALLEHAGVKMPLERIFGLGTGPKADVLAELLDKHGSSSRLHFLEDRVETLELVSSDERLENVQLYLCDWGFNTAVQRAKGAANPRVQIIGSGDILGVFSPKARAPASEC